MEPLELARQLFFEGLNCLEGARFREAEAKFQESLQIIPDRASTLTNLSVAQFRLGKFQAAADSAQRALNLDGSNADAWLNKGNAMYALEEHVEAIACYDRAIQLKPDNPQAWSNKGASLTSLERYEEALAHHDRAIAIGPTYAEGRTNKGLTLRKCRRFEEALACHDQAIALQRGYANAWLNKGLTLIDLQRKAEGLQLLDHAIALKPDLEEAWQAKGSTLAELQRYEEALDSHRRALALKPDSASLLAELTHVQMLAGDWRDLAERNEALLAKVADARASIEPFVLLSITDSPGLQRRAAENWTNHKYPLDASLPTVRRNKHRKIRVGYFSADFRDHPVATLTAELFENHDRKRFEVVGFSLRASNEDDPLRERLRLAFDQFFDVENRSDRDVTKLARELEIDIAVDLGGHTHGARTRIFSCRAAPIQVNFLGYPGTMGASYMDYIIADRSVIPDEELPNYSEKAVFLPNSFQPSDTRRAIASKPSSRQEVSLPAGAFVYCCFNNNYKINPEIFGRWMNILRGTQNSCLWLLSNAKLVESRYRAAAEHHGIDPGRLVFASRVPADQYRARLRLADLFLDTLPFNAGATASDALWAGLPVLTQTGRSFCGRMATSLLRAAGLPELISSTPEEYESLAVACATNPENLRRPRERLATNRLSLPLFDSRLYARHLESAYATMHERHQEGLPSAHILIERQA